MNAIQSICVTIKGVESNPTLCYNIQRRSVYSKGVMLCTTLLYVCVICIVLCAGAASSVGLLVHCVLCYDSQHRLQHCSTAALYTTYLRGAPSCWGRIQCRPGPGHTGTCLTMCMCYM